MSNKWKIIFLDLDGVINGYDPIKLFLHKYFRPVYKSLYTKRGDDLLYGVDKSKIKRLGLICKLTGANVVLTSCWRDTLYDKIQLFNSKPEIYQSISQYDLKDKITKTAYYFKKYKITIVGKTCHDPKAWRENEILHWMGRHNNLVDKFIILDDESRDLPMFEGGQLIKTRFRYKKIHREGLFLKHVILAVKKLGLYKRETYNF